ncbi:MAG: CDC48 family AAA ATPase [Candidatus Woesearchaeota archaeon]
MDDVSDKSNPRQPDEVMSRVTEGLRLDVGKKIARIPGQLMERLGVEAGDTVMVEGKRKTVATIWRSRPEDEDSFENIVRIDGNIRHNAGTSLGEKVKLKKTECNEAKSMTIAPLQNVSYSGDPTKYFTAKLIDKPFVKGDKLIIDVMGTPLHYLVISTSPKGFVRFTNVTDLSIASEKVSPEDTEAMPEINYEDIGGLDQEIDQIREMVELPMKHPEVFEHVGIGAPKGVLLTGPPGTGKTLLAKAVAAETESNFYSINGPEIMSKYYGESEKQLRSVFEKADKDSPSIIFIDELDSIAPKRSETTGEVERRVVAQLLTLMDGLKSRGQVVVIAATNRDDALDSALRRPGRFDREIAINPPQTQARKEILQIHTRGMPLDDSVDFDKLADTTMGYTGADLEVLCKEAALNSLKVYMPDLKHYDQKVPSNVLEKIKIKMDDFVSAFRKVEPSAMREVLIRKPDIKYSDIGGLDEIKGKMQEIIEWPLKSGEMFKKTGITPPRGIILSGPPGTGKTLLAKAVANEAEANFISVKGPELISKWVGESEKHVREIFKKARQVAPSIIFFDEFDSIASTRTDSSSSSSEERVVNQLLTEIDGIEELSGVTVIAATNRVDLVDPALLRPGRFDEIIELDLPDTETRRKIVEVHTKNMPLENVDLDKVVSSTESLSGADIASICKNAGMNAIRRAFSQGNNEVKVRDEDFRSAIDKVKNKLTKTQNVVNYIA